MHVLLICNKKENLGDYNQVSAVAHLLAQEFPEVGNPSLVTEIQVSPRERTKILFQVFLKTGFWRAVGPGGRWGWLWRRLFTTYTDLAALEPDVIVARLQSSEHAAVALKYWFSIPAFFVGEPENLDPTCFDLVFTTRAEPQFPNQVLLGTVPSQLTVPGHVGERVPVLEHIKAPVWTFLVGGAKPCYPIHPEDASHWIDFILGAHREHGVKWCVSTSRRTDEWLEDMLRSALEGSPALLDATWWADAPRATLAPYIKHANLCLVTAESQSMISDCLTLLKPVIALQSQNMPRGPFSISDLRDCARIKTFLEANRSNKRIVISDSSTLSSSTDHRKLLSRIVPFEESQTWSHVVNKNVRRLFERSIPHGKT